MRASWVVGVLACSSIAHAQVNAGVSDERISLPQAPGSVSGVGENASTGGNHGALSYAVKFEVPQGFPGLTPELSLTYSSSGGASVAGLGWSLPGFSIERMTARGLQKYDQDDLITDGSQELVRVSQSGTTATYRARFEGSFVRYTWNDRGAAGWWKVEYPDGRVGYFGADASGTPVTTAQVRTPNGTNTFSWHLVAMEDPWGHRMTATWVKDPGGQPLLDRMEWLFEGSLPRHQVRFAYEARTDRLSDGKPGFELALTQRLKEVRIFSGTTTPEQVRRYLLEYEPAATSAGATRLASVSRFGQGDVLYPVKFTFGYSRTLGGACTTDCQKPFVASMGNLGAVDFTTGRATLVDINGDALPDVLFSSAGGQHQFFYARLDSEGHASFSSTGVTSSKTGTTSAYILGDPQVQLLDVNGDGFMDLTQARLGQVLCNDGSGDWVDSTRCTQGSMAVPSTYTLDDDPDVLQVAPQNIRFFDYDNDKRIDWLRTLPGGTTTQVLSNGMSGLTASTIDNIGRTFDVDPLELADVNGDGLQDPVELQVSGASVTLNYKLNFGRGQWSPSFQQRTVTGFNTSQASVAELQDLNGDGLTDVVAVTGSTVAFSLNRGDSFSPVMSLTSADLGAGTLPTRGTGTTLSFADMNGNGSDDIVWFQQNGDIQYLELFPVRPNLISRIENGLGAVQQITYGTSIAEQARDTLAGRPWPHRVPNASVLITRLDSWVTLTGSDSGGLHEVIDYRYHQGFYDGVEKQFRGYERVENELPADANDAHEPTLIVLDFDVGLTSPAFAGRQLRRSVYSLATATAALLQEQRSLYELCPLNDVATTMGPAVQFVCQRATTTVHVERDPANAITTEVQRDYDGYGNVTREANLGVKHLGTPEQPRACEACVASGVFGAPCGDMCLGDEDFTQTTFIDPGTATGGRWMVGQPSVEKSGAVANALAAETRTFYDGPAFVGLGAGQLTKGGVSRVSSAVDGTRFIDVSRYERDAQGNLITSLHPNAAVNDTTFRTSYVWEPGGTWVSTTTVALATGRVLRRDSAAEPLFEQRSETSNWYAVVNGQPVAAPQLTRIRYDAHGRMSKRLDPGDTDASPGTEFQYELAAPLSRIVALRRSSQAGAQDLVSAGCYDGRGRLVQSRQRLGDTLWQVSGFTEFDHRGATVRSFEPWQASSGACDMTVPQGVKSVRSRFDSLSRLVSEVEPDQSTRREEWGPLVHRVFDEDDTDPSSAFPNTPLVEVSDGLGRLVSLTRTGLDPGTVRVAYDAQGALASVKDPLGTEHLQVNDLLGRVTRITDVNSGVTTLEYDAAGNVVRRVDARGVAVRTDFDARNRPLAQWDEANEATTKVTWSYDAVSGCTDCTHAGGQLAQVEYPAGRDRLGYDTRGHLVFRERTLDGQPLVVRYQYDGADRQISATYPAGLTVERRYDSASRVSSLPNLVDRVEYDERALLKTVAAKNGVTTSFGYDSRRRLASRSATGPAGALFDLAFTRSANGQLKTITDAATRATRARHGAVFTYDAWNRLATADLDRAEGANDVLTFAWDARDNATSQTSSLGATSAAHVGTFTYDPVKLNAVISAGALTSTWDDAGHLRTRGASTYTFDFMGRLEAVTNGTVDGTFRFGAGPQRVAKKEGAFSTRYETDAFEVRDGIAVVYAKLGDERVARLESDSLAATLLSDLAPATGTGPLVPAGNQTIDIADAWLAQAAAIGALQLQGGPAPSSVEALLASSARRLLMRDVTWLHSDHQRNLIAATDGAGALVGERSFFPTGEVRSSDGFVDVYGFSAQEREASTGLIHFAWRDLDPTSGRWTSVDPAFESLSATTVRRLGESTTAYAYVANDPGNHVDPTGLALTGGQARPSLISRIVARIKGKSAAQAKAKPAAISRTTTASKMPVVTRPPPAPSMLERIEMHQQMMADARKEMAARFPDATTAPLHGPMEDTPSGYFLNEFNQFMHVSVVTTPEGQAEWYQRPRAVQNYARVPDSVFVPAAPRAPVAESPYQQTPNIPGGITQPAAPAPAAAAPAPASASPYQQSPSNIPGVTQ
ncbi:MAG: toxin TcdB middle/N-terminal domain-containing protein [Myxococcaceae bacterium]